MSAGSEAIEQNVAQKKAAQQGEERLWTKGFVMSVVTLMSCHMGPYLLIAVISVFAKQVTGSDTYAGMMSSVFALSGLVARFLSATLLDRAGAKRVMLGAMAVMAAASFAYMFVDSYWPAFVLRGVQGLGYGVAVTATSTYIVRIVPKSRRLEGIGYSSLTNSLGGIVGPTCAYAILGSAFDRFQILFIAVFATTIATIALMFTLREAAPQVADKGAAGDADKGGLSWAGILAVTGVPFAAYFLSCFAGSSVSSFLALFAIDRGLGNISLYFTCNAIGLFASRFAMKRMDQALGGHRLLVLMLMVASLATLALSMVSELWQLVLFALPYGFALGAIGPVVNALLVDRLPESQVGLANAIFFAAGDLGFIIGATLWGIVASSLSYGGMYLVAGLVCCASAGVVLFDRR